MMVFVLGAATAALLLTAPVAAAAPVASAGVVAHDVVQAQSATVLSGRDLSVRVIYTCTTGNTLSVAVAQPPAQAGKLPLRVGAGYAAAKCDGKLYTLDVPAKPSGAFTGQWEKGKPATVGAVVSTVTHGKAQLRAKDSRQLILR